MVHDAALLAHLNAPIQQLHADALPTRFKAPLPNNPELIAFYTERLARADWVGYVAEKDETAVGYILCAIVCSPESVLTYADTSLLIDQLSVNPEYQRCGYGHALMQAAIALAHEVQASCIILNVWAFNQQARAFYEKLNFQPMAHKLQWIRAVTS
jgi:ribosomal protein S18 acetylase RimI-like enzyme